MRLLPVRENPLARIVKTTPPIPIAMCTIAGVSPAAESPWGQHGPLQVSDNRWFLVHRDGTPFFYLGDTAWELFHRLNREEAGAYLADRAAKASHFKLGYSVAVRPEALGVC